MKTVIEMAREASDPDKVDPWRDGFWILTQEELERFADLVRADEREAYAHLAEKLTWADNKGVASAIRAQQALDKMAENARELGLDYEPAQQEPVAFLVDGDLYYPEEIDWETLQEQGHTVAPLYTSPPPQRTWVGLTDEEAMQVCVDCGCLSEDWLTLLDAIEAKLKEKNNG